MKVWGGGGREHKYSERYGQSISRKTKWLVPGFYSISGFCFLISILVVLEAYLDEKFAFRNCGHFYLYSLYLDIFLYFPFFKTFIPLCTGENL